MWRKILFALLLLAASAAGQTVVSGTVVDPNGVPYANGTIMPTLVTPGGPSPYFTATGAPYITPSTPTKLDSTGTFAVALADNTTLSPASTTWNFTVCSGPGSIMPAAGTGSQCFSLASPITISGSTQNISTNLNAVAPYLGRAPSAGGANIPVGVTVTNVGAAGSTLYTYGVSGTGTAVATRSTTTGNATLNSTNYNTVACSATGPQPALFTFYRIFGGTTQGKIGTATTCSFSDQGASGDGSLPPLATSTGVTAGRESIGQKLRRLAAKAAASNPLNQIALSAPPAWVTATAYGGGDAVTSDTPSQVYLNINGLGCTSGASAPTGTGLTVISDGSGKCSWQFLDNSYPSTSSPLMPTVTNQTTTPSGLTLVYYPNTNPASFFCGGGHPVIANTHFYNFWSSTVVSGGNFAGDATKNMGDTWSCTFETDAPKFAVASYGSYGPRLIVDGNLLQIGGFVASTAGSPSWQVVDYAGVRKRRRVTMQGFSSDSFQGVRVDSASTIWPVSTGDHVRAIFIGDSITAGSAGGPLGSGWDWPAQFSFLVGIDDPWNIAEGGTGFLANNSGQGYTYLGHIQDFCNNSPDVGFIFDDINDEGTYTPAQITTAALATFQAMRDCAPGVPIVAMGAWPGNSGPSATRLTSEAAILSAFTQWNDSLSYYIPISNDPTGSWVSGTGTVGATTGTGNADSCIAASPTAPHPIQLCINTIAQRVNTVFRQNILPLIP